MTDLELLTRIAVGDVTWRGSLHTSFRLWSTEHVYKTITPRMKRLRAEHAEWVKLEHAAGYGYADFGPVEITAAGRAMLP